MHVASCICVSTLQWSIIVLILHPIVVEGGNEIDYAVAASEKDNDVRQQMIMISDDSVDESTDPGDPEQAG